MSATDAAYRLAHRYPGGVAALAARLGMSANTLQHKLNPHCSTHHLYLSDAEALTALTGDPEIAQALAFACGHVCIPAPSVIGADGALAERIASVGREFGDVMRATLDAIADGRVTQRELAEYDAQFHEFLAAAVGLRQKLVELIPRPPSESRPGDRP